MGLIAEDTVAHIVVVGRLHVIEQDDILQLHGVAHHAMGAHQRAAADKGAVAHLRLRADDARAGDGCRGRDVRRPVHPHLRAKGQIFAVQLCAQRTNAVRQVGERLPGIGKAGQVVPRQCMCQIIKVVDGVHSLLLRACATVRTAPGCYVLSILSGAAFGKWGTEKTPPRRFGAGAFSAISVVKRLHCGDFRDQP